MNYGITSYGSGSTYLQPLYRPISSSRLRYDTFASAAGFYKIEMQKYVVGGE